jgi:thiosulfate dehydrogenase
VRGFLLGLIVGILLLPAFVFCYLRFGYAPVAASAPPLPFEGKLTMMALHARVDKEAPKEVPLQATEANLVAGVKLYREYCAMCHGTTGEPKTAIAKGMFPSPPQLFHGEGVTDDPPGETFWKAANGIRLTGMPAFRGSLSDDELWQVSLALANADKLPQSAKDILAGPAPTPAH